MKYIYILIIIFIGLIPECSYSAAWTQEKGRAQLILTHDTYSAERYYGANSKGEDSGSSFNKSSFNAFVEYGLKDDITIGLSPTFSLWQYRSVSQQNGIIDTRGCGIASTGNNRGVDGQTFETDIFMRKQLYKGTNAVFSVQPLIKSPCVFIRDYNSSINWHSHETEIRLLAGYGFKLENIVPSTKIKPFPGQYHFVNLEAAYRKRNGEFSDQIKLDGSLGIRYSEKILFLSQVFSTFSKGKENFGPIETSQNSFQPNYNRYYTTKIQFSSILQVTKDMSIQMGSYQEISGQNYAKGQGVTLSIWKGF